MRQHHYNKLPNEVFENPVDEKIPKSESTTENNEDKFAKEKKEEHALLVNKIMTRVVTVLVQNNHSLSQTLTNSMSHLNQVTQSTILARVDKTTDAILGLEVRMWNRTEIWSKE